MLKNKAIGTYFALAAAVLSIVAIILYGGAYLKVTPPYIWLVVAAVAGIASLKLGGWGAAIGACASALAMTTSTNVMLDPVGYVVSGLYQMDTLTGWITFMVVCAVAMLIFIIAGFLKFDKAEK